MNRLPRFFVLSAVAVGALACSAAPPAEDPASTDDALRRRGVEVDPDVGRRQPPPACLTNNPECSVVPIPDWVEEEVREMRAHGCEAPFQYKTGGNAGILGATMSVCVDNARARTYVAGRSGRWAPDGFCDTCLARLPAGKKYVVWVLSIGPNCGSGCKPGLPPW